jgi:DNA repair exonuclease SbcCD ATPase subunit
MTTNKPDITAKYEEERLRAHEQSQIVYLQGQIDELRRLLKDQSNKYSWAMEQVRKTEASVVQVQGIVERHAEEVSQANELVRRDVVALRKEVAGALVKIDEGVRPIRDLQAQIQQVAEARKQDRDYVSSWLGRIEVVERQILDVQAQVKELDERQRQLLLQLDRLREADTVAVQEARRVGEELQIEKQSLRRQAVEATQLVGELRSILDEHASRIARIDEIRQHIDLFSETLPKQLTDLAAKLPDIVADIKRVERISTERFLMNQERLEEVRQASDEKIDVLQEADEQHLRQLTAWLERIDSYLREIEQRLTRSTTRLEHAHQTHIVRVAELERRELITLDTLFAAFRTAVEQTRSAQVEAKGDGGKG